jgi:hypothetical protein
VKVEFTDEEILQILVVAVVKFGVGYPPSDRLARERRANQIPELEPAIQRHGPDSIESKWGDIRAEIIPDLVDKRGTTKQVTRIVAMWHWLVPEHERELLRRYGYARPPDHPRVNASHPRVNADSPPAKPSPEGGGRPLSRHARRTGQGR